MKKIEVIYKNKFYTARLANPSSPKERYMIGTGDTREEAIIDLIEANPGYFNIEII